MLPPRGELAVQSSDPGHLIAVYNPLIVAVFRRTPRAEELDALTDLSARGLAAGIRGGFLYVIAREDMAGGIDPRVRTLFEGMIRKNQADSGSSAVVVLTAGFAAAMVRAVLAGLLQLTSRRKMIQVFGSVDSACAWLEAEHDLDPGALLRAYQGATTSLSA